jgi:hypothetical protein
MVFAPAPPTPLFNGHVPSAQESVAAGAVPMMMTPRPPLAPRTALVGQQSLSSGGRPLVPHAFGMPWELTHSEESARGSILHPTPATPASMYSSSMHPTATPPTSMHPTASMRGTTANTAATRPNTATRRVLSEPVRRDHAEIRRDEQPSLDSAPSWAPSQPIQPPQQPPRVHARSLSARGGASSSVPASACGMARNADFTGAATIPSRPEGHVPYRLPDPAKKRTSLIASVPPTASGSLGMGASSTMLSGGGGGGGGGGGYGGGYDSISPSISPLSSGCGPRTGSSSGAPRLQSSAGGACNLPSGSVASGEGECADDGTTGTTVNGLQLGTWYASNGALMEY